MWHLWKNSVLLGATIRNNLAVGLTTALYLLGANFDAFIRCAIMLVVLTRLRSELLFQVLHALILHSRISRVLLLGALYVPLPSLRLKGSRSFELLCHIVIFSLCHGRVSGFRLTHRVCCARSDVQCCQIRGTQVKRKFFTILVTSRFCIYQPIRRSIWAVRNLTIKSAPFRSECWPRVRSLFFYSHRIHLNCILALLGCINGWKRRLLRRFHVLCARSVFNGLF